VLPSRGLFTADALPLCFTAPEYLQLAESNVYGLGQLLRRYKCLPATNLEVYNSKSINLVVFTFWREGDSFSGLVDVLPCLF
jgi:hypothetical protein